MQSLDLQQLELIFYLLLGLIALTLGGLVIYVVIANRRERERLAQTYELESLVPRPALQVTGQILSLVRDEPGSPLQVEIGGHRYHHMGEIQEQQLRRQVVDAAMELIWFTGALRGSDLAPTSMDETHSWREDVRHGSKSELQRIRTAAAPATGEKAARQGAGPARDQGTEERRAAMPGDPDAASPSPERPNLVSALQRRWAPKLPDREAPHTFVDQIDAIVQRRIQLIPALTNRELHVRPGLDGSVRFVFEGEEYESLDDVPNLTARQVVKDAIQEWDETT
jgi:hypothetical protein